MILTYARYDPALAKQRGVAALLDRIGNDIRLYLVHTEVATDVSGLPSLAVATYQPVEKTLLLDLGDLGTIPDNIEGMTFGPNLADGRRSLVLVPDDNFSDTQITQVLAFAVDIGGSSTDFWQ